MSAKNMTTNIKSPVSVIIVGAGHRAMVYASYALEHPDRMKIVGVADPNSLRRQQVRDIYGIPADACFASAEELALRPQLADAIINGTMDHQHIDTSVPLLKRGYHLLLEKPICQTPEDLSLLGRTAQENDRRVMICHVLRYAPFYQKIKELVAGGEIGDLLHIGAIEEVSYHHYAVAFVRGKWNQRKTNPILLAKCCHDLDLICWLASGIRPAQVSSFGVLNYFRPENAPEGAGTRCLVDCQIENSCKFSAKKNYVDFNFWDFYAWDSIEHIVNPTREDKLKSLATDNPFGRCVWHCDNDVLDHQTVMIEFENGLIADHQLIGNTPKGDRRIHLVGTEGEIFGFMKEGTFILRKPEFAHGCSFVDQKMDVNISGDMHGGGDLRLVDDFVRVLLGEQPSLSTTDLFDSVNSHMIAFAADEALLKNKNVDLAGSDKYSLSMF
jgi:predicted dehydrogenase